MRHFEEAIFNDGCRSTLKFPRFQLNFITFVQHNKEKDPEFLKEVLLSQIITFSFLNNTLTESKD